MSFKLFLEEQQLDNLDNLITVIKKDCQPFLTEGDGDVLYRGVKDESKIKVPRIITPRTDRRPLNTEQDLSDAFNRWLLKNIGWKARTEGLFCHSASTEALAYGEPQIVFPRGEFKFLAIKRKHLGFIYDSMSVFAAVKRYLKSEGSQRLEDTKHLFDQAFEDAMEYEFSTVTDNLKECLKSQTNAEIVIKCSSAIYVPLSFLTTLTDVEADKTEDEWEKMSVAKFMNLLK